MGHDSVKESWLGSMDSDDKFWLGLYTAFFTAVVFVVLIVSGYWQHHNTLIAEMAIAGVDPVAIMCAMQDDYGKAPTCIVLATQQ